MHGLPMHTVVLHPLHDLCTRFMNPQFTARQPSSGLGDDSSVTISGLHIFAIEKETRKKHRAA